MRHHITPVRMAINRKFVNNKYQWGCAEWETLVYVWWGCKLVQPLWKTMWIFLRKLKRKLPYDQIIPLLDMYPKIKQKILLMWKDTCSPMFIEGFPGGSDGKESSCNARDLGSIPGLGRSPGGGHGNPLQYSCLGNPMDRGVWQTTVHIEAKSGTEMSRWAYTMYRFQYVRAVRLFR